MNLPDFPISFAPTPEEYLDNDSGSVLSPNMVHSDPEGFADAFCEGSPALKQTLLYLWANNVHTAGCCVGHEGIHSYEKQTLFGRKEIDKDTYLAHCNSKRYIDNIIKSEYHAYLAIKPVTLDEAKKIHDIIDVSLKAVEPVINFGSYVSGNIVTFSLDSYEPPHERERFFNALYHVISKDLIPQLTGMPVHQAVSLNDRIAAASERVEKTPQNKTLPIYER